MSYLNKINNKLQEKLEINQYELNFVYLLLLGLFLSTIFKNYTHSETAGTPEFEEVSQIIYNKLDSLEKVDKTTYIGTDEEGNKNQSLQKADTIINKNLVSPVKEKKQLPSKKINLNTATKFELMKLPGIGEKTADIILDYKKNNKFNKIEDIMNVKGIGPKKFEKMREFIVIE